MKIYLAGPMRGYPEFNHPAFRAGARQLRSAGHEVFSPAEHNERLGMDTSASDGDQAAIEAEFPLRKLLGDDLAWICAHAGAVALLPGWEASLGAQAEAAVARALGLPARELRFFLRDDLAQVRESRADAVPG
jgi:nucleoside 2-deoxyribosyltransferase